MKTLQMIFGVIIGISGTLLLTLNVWGTAWYQVIISLFAGVILGLFVADHKVASRVVVKAAKDYVNYVKKNYKDSNLKNLFIKRFKFSRSYLIVLTFLLAVTAIVVTACYLQIFKYSLNTFGVHVFVSFLGGILVYPNSWKDACPDKILKVVWGKNFNLEAGVINIDSVNFVSAFIRSICCGVVTSVFVLVALLLLIYSGIVWVFSMILGIASLPIYIIKKISQCSFSITISMSIVIGGLIGTFCVSYILGIIAGVGFLIVLLIIKKWLSEDFIKLFFRYERGLPGYMTFGLFS